MAATITIHIAIKGFSKYLDYKLDIRQDQFTSVANSVNKNYTISFGSALLFSFILIGGMLEKYGSRHTRLFILLPLQFTAMTVVFPLLIILGNSKLKKKLYKILARRLTKFLKRFYSNRIYVIVWAQYSHLKLDLKKIYCSVDELCCKFSK